MLGVTGANKTNSDGYQKKLLLTSLTSSIMLRTLAQNSAIEFRVGGSSSADEKMRITSTGRLGIGTTIPSHKLHIVDNISSSANIADRTLLKIENKNALSSAHLDIVDGATALVLRSYGENYAFDGNAGRSTIANSSKGLTIAATQGGDLSFRVGNNSLPANERMNIDGSGVVRINNSCDVSSISNMKADVKLAVAGGVVCDELLKKSRTAANCWPDFVFEENYKLKSLSDVESFINENKHLPGVPSAKEISEEGVNMVEMNKILLQKVEELTLHVIELEKQIKSQR